MRETGLKTPPELRPDVLRIIPLGGLGDIGRNMSCLEINDEILLIDCGVLFPEDNQPGVDLILPSLDYLDDKLDRVQALVLTHGHEDHIGAVPYLLRKRPNIPVYGSRLTIAFVESKIKEHRIHGTDLRIVREGEHIKAGNEYRCEFLAVTHSIPDSLAVAVRTAAGMVLNTGDFKMDQLPLDGRISDLRGFARLGEEGVDLFMVDSTNADVPGFVRPERDIEPAMEAVFNQSRQKIVVACFASHVHRVQQVLGQAVKHDRKVCFIGRSMVRNMGIAAELGFLDIPEDVMISMKDLEYYPDEQLVIISTGSQGEPLSALARMANNEHRSIKINAGDTVLLASSLIPGNENAVSRVINGLSRLGAKVVHKGNALVHVTGHSCAGELLYCYNVIQPFNVMPIHGETRHMIAAAELAIQTGLPRQNAIVVHDGDVIDLEDHQAKVVGSIDASYIFVDGSTVGDISEVSLTDRRLLGEEGFISIVAAVDLRSRMVISGPDISAKGFAEGEGIFDDVSGQVGMALLDALTDGVDDTYRLQQVMRRVVGKWVSKTYRRRPMIVPVVVAV